MLERTIKYNEPSDTSTKNGNAIVLSEEDYNNLMETLYIESIPGMKEEIISGMKEPIEEYVEAMVVRNLFRYTLQQKNQKDKKLANKFIDEVFRYLNSEFPRWKKNRIWKKRNILKRTIEKSKLLTKIYCKIK